MPRDAQSSLGLSRAGAPRHATIRDHVSRGNQRDPPPQHRSTDLTALSLRSHPPGGAVALLAVTISQIAEMGWWYIPMVLQASLIMLGWALLINNVGGRRYPSECSLVLACLFAAKSPDRLAEVCLQINGSGRWIII